MDTLSLSFIGFTMGFIGKVLVAYTAIKVHRRFRLEHKIDDKVFRVMRKEQMIGVFGIALMTFGYFLEAPSHI